MQFTIARSRSSLALTLFAAAALLAATGCGKSESKSAPAATTEGTGTAAAAATAGQGAGAAVPKLDGVIGVDIDGTGNPLVSLEEEAKRLEAAKATGQQFSIKMFMSELSSAYCRQNIGCGLDSFADLAECVDKTGFVKNCSRNFDNCDAEIPGHWVLECVMAVKRLTCDPAQKRVMGDLPEPCRLAKRIAASTGQ